LLRGGQFLALFALWLALSGRLQPAELTLGALSAALVVFLTNDLLFPPKEAEGEGLLVWAPWERLRPHWLLIYFPWLLLQIVQANLQVAYLALHPRVPVDPVLVQFDTPMRGHPSQVLLAHSITLTPGTITVDAWRGRFVVHAITPQSAASLLAGEMQRRVGRVFSLTMPQPTSPLITRDPGELQL